MENGKKMYVTAEEAAEMLGVSTGYAYKIIRGLNEELKAKEYKRAVFKAGKAHVLPALKYPALVLSDF